MTCEIRKSYNPRCRLLRNGQKNLPTQKEAPRACAWLQVSVGHFRRKGCAAQKAFQGPPQADRLTALRFHATAAPHIGPEEALPDSQRGVQRGQPFAGHPIPGQWTRPQPLRFRGQQASRKRRSSKQNQAQVKGNGPKQSLLGRLGCGFHRTPRHRAGHFPGNRPGSLELAQAQPDLEE